ncbi:MAG: helix-turn-helix domain-containing protein [Luteolibacter sp.]
MNYTQLSEDERNRIGALRSEPWTMSFIARRLGRSCSTTSRELKRKLQA